MGTGRECKYSGARRGIGGIRGNGGPRDVWVLGPFRGVRVYWASRAVGTQGPEGL